MLTETQSLRPKKLAWIQSLLLPVLVAALLIAALYKWIEWEPAFLRPSHNELFQVRNGTWQRLPELRGEVETLRVSAGGTVWALYWHNTVGSELARLDRPSWRVFKPADFGTPGVDLSGGFVMDGEQVWAATGEGVLHWDGHHWNCYRDAIGKEGASSIAVANGKVWVIDDSGNLSHFDGSQWTRQKVELPGAKWDSSEDYSSPELALTDDGSLWIVRDGVWRSDGPQWVAAKLDGEDLTDASLVGSTGKGVWLWSDGSLLLVGPGGTLEEFGSADMGFSARESLNEVVRTGDRTYAATTLGIREFDGVKWRRLASPRNGVKSVVSIRADAGGGLFAIGNIPNPRARLGRFLQAAVPLALSLGLLVVPVWMVRRHKRDRLTEHQRLQQAVAHATGAVPEEFARDERLLQRQSSWWAATAAVGVVVGAMMAYSITRFFWPAEPPWMFLAIALALHAVVTLGQTLVRRTPKPWDPIEPGGPRFDWAPTLRAVPASLVVFVLMNFGAVQKWMGDPIRLLYVIPAMMWYWFFEQVVMNSAIRRGDYDGALRVVRRFRFCNPEGGAALRQRGLVLLIAGRFGEAEVALRRAVATLRSRAAQARALEYLGDVLLEQGRYEDAQRSYEAALHALPGFRRPYRGMAELLLRQGGDPARALECVENIVGSSGPSRNRFTLNGQSRDDYWSLKAWALAEAGRGAEVERAVAEAIKFTTSKSGPDLAATYRRLGLAMHAMDRQAEAEEYWKKAKDADPHGRWSALARAALGEKSVWRV
jgi:tetratricopeptide (TPR) repeat protein